jgi:nitrate reductase gamma subunit
VKEAAMRLLDFARGPGLHWALVIMVAGFFWRGADFALRRGERNLHWARKGLHLPDRRWQIDSYAMHAGLLIVMFGFAPHILFISALTGLQWPSLPIAVVLASAVISLTSMVAVLIHRVTTPDPSIFSALDDYFTWSAVFIAMLTGLLCYPHVGGAPVFGPYALLLSAHLLAVELLMIWLPFGKLIHVAFMPMLQAALAIRQIVVKTNIQARRPRRSNAR